MDLNIFKFSAILGLICIIIGISLTKQSQKRKQFILLIIGGLLLEAYSIHIKDTVFIILQAVFTISVVYQLAGLYNKAKKLEKPIKQYLLDLEKHLIKFHKKK